MPGLVPAKSSRADSGATFSKVTSGDIVTIPALYWGGSWGDYDDDGYLDLFVGASYASQSNFLYHNDRNGTFTLVDPQQMPKSPSNQHGAAWGDYDNDGHLDLIVTSGNPEIAHTMLYRNNGDATFSWTTDNAIYNDFYYVYPGVHAPSWGDYDNDGLLDLFLAGHDVRNRLFHNEGGGSFTRITDHVLVNDPSSSEGRAWIDYDDDGDLDLFVSNFNHPNVLYRNDGTGVFTKVADNGLSAFPSTVGSCWADYDNDGFADLFLANARRNFLYRNDGDGTLARVLDSGLTQDRLPATAVFAACAWGDYDNDGFIDLFVPTVDFTFPVISGDRSFLYRNNGDGTFEKVTQGSIVTDPTTGSSGASWEDYDNDGFLDLFVAQGALSPRLKTNLLYHNDGNANAWLNVKLVGTISNRSAIGAKVRVNAFYRGASRWQLRDVSGGDSTSNQQSLNAEFGLADAVAIDTLRVEWPSGIVQELHDVAPRQFLTITEILPVHIEVAPGNGRKPVQPGSMGVIQVALLGSADLDVREVDPAALAFGPAQAEPARGRRPQVEDVNSDGIADLVARFHAGETGIEPGDDEACLSGRLVDGPPFEGCGAIRTVPADATASRQAARKLQ